MPSDGCARRASYCLLQQCFWMSSRRLSTFAPVIMATCFPGTGAHAGVVRLADAAGLVRGCCG
jgi:hypothetical protein